MTSRHAQRSDRSPLHDVRHHACRSTKSTTCGFFVSHERVSKADCSKPAALSGGARRDRTDDLLLAKQALSQLSYGPSPVGSQPASLLGLPAVARGSLHGPPSPRLWRAAFAALRERRLVGLGRFELPTSRLSSARSNQLSYKPGSEDRGRTTENR